MKTEVMERVQAHFRPEFINRIDDIIVFHPLGDPSRSAPSSISSWRASRRGWPSATWRWSLPTTARDLLGEAGFDPVYGARPLKRAIQQQIENPLAERILQGQFAPGDRILVAAEGGLLKFEKRAN